MIKPAALAAAASLIVGAIGMAAVSSTDVEVREETMQRYCEGVELWQGEADRGVPAERRLGQPDYKNIAADSCPEVDYE